MHYENIGILLTDQYTAECDICCFSCSPHKNTWLEADKVIESIRATEKIKEIKQVGFSGGELFLDFFQFTNICERSKFIGKDMQTEGQLKN